jgi:hypothetical protein
MIHRHYLTNKNTQGLFHADEFFPLLEKVFFPPAAYLENPIHNSVLQGFARKTCLMLDLESQAPIVLKF